MSDTFKDMWEDQEAFIKLLQEKRDFPSCPVDITTKQGQKVLKDIMHHCMDELFESGQHLKNHKSHRLTDIPDIDRVSYIEELCDAYKLFLELAIMSGISREEFIEAFKKKSAINVERITGSY